MGNFRARRGSHIKDCTRVRLLAAYKISEKPVHFDENVHVADGRVLRLVYYFPF
jgi:hypothetical protein